MECHRLAYEYILLALYVEIHLSIPPFSIQLILYRVAGDPGWGANLLQGTHYRQFFGYANQFMLYTHL